MSFEFGITSLIQGTPAVSTIAKVGGFMVMLPQNQVLPSWSFQMDDEELGYSHDGPTGLLERRLQVDCYGGGTLDASGETAATTVQLATAIAGVLDGYRGMLGDDTTRIQSCIRMSARDFFDDTGRNWRRMLEYRVRYSTVGA